MNHDQSWVMGVLEPNVAYAAVAIDHLGFVLDTNSAADHLFDDNVFIKNKRLVASDPQARSALENLIQRLVATPVNDQRWGDPIVIRRDGRRPIIAKMLQVPAAAKDLFLGARALLAFFPLEPKPRPDAPLLCKAFGLTPAEARLAAALANGTSLEAAADELHISRETTRTQLKMVFAKTDTHRQSQLVALLSRI